MSVIYRPIGKHLRLACTKVACQQNYAFASRLEPELRLLDYVFVIRYPCTLGKYSQVVLLCELSFQ